MYCLDFPSGFPTALVGAAAAGIGRFEGGDEATIAVAGAGESSDCEAW